MEFQIEINNKQIRVQEGETLLSALRRNAFRIPTLCHMNRFSPSGACRLCVVEVEGKRDLITSCSHPVEQGMRVRTNSQRVIRARKSLVELLLSNHPDDCLYCQRNGHCELQWLAEEMNVKERRFFGKKNTWYPDYSSTSVARDPAKCVLCSRCVRICEEVQLVTAIDFISRGNQTRVNSAFNKGLNESSCIHCGQCIQVCPTAALLDISHVEKVQAALGKESQQVIFSISPSVVASVTDKLGFKSKAKAMDRIAAALNRCGASKVFDLGIAYDVNVLEDARILADRLAGNGNGSGALPLMSSCCPSWVKYVQSFRPGSLAHLSGAKSPQQIFGTLVKTVYAEQEDIARDSIFSVTVMPCVAEKYEASLEENTHKGVSEVDAVLTVREFFQLLRGSGLDIAQMEEEAPDGPYNTSSDAAWKAGYSGGKAEAVARELFRMLADPKKERFKFNLPKNISGRREIKVPIGGREIGFAWVSSIVEAEDYIMHLEEEKRDDIHYIEVMACLGGCVGGGGQPVNRGFENVKSRKRICVEMEKNALFKLPVDNPGIKPLYKGKRLLSDNPTALEWLGNRFMEK